jgi:hypothetical protein
MSSPTTAKSILTSPGANPYTQKSIERRMKAALAVGLRVVGVTPDGTVLTEERNSSVTTITVVPLTDRPKLRDAREKLGSYLNPPDVSRGSRGQG